MEAESQLQALRSRLYSDKVTTRKEGVKLLETLLDSTDFIEYLDGKTLDISPDQKIPVASWPGLCHVFTGFLRKELEATLEKKRGPDIGLARVFKKLVQTAENEQRTGSKNILVRTAERLFEHVAVVLCTDGLLTSPLGAEYCAVLRNTLLTSHKLAQHASSRTFQDLIGVFMTRFEVLVARADSALHGEEALRCITMLLSLTQQFPGDMAPCFRLSLLEFHQALFRKLYDRRDTTRVAVAAVGAVNALLMLHGLDLSSRASALHEALHPFLKFAWGDTRQVKLKEALVMYVRLQLQLGGLQDGGLSDCWDIMQRDLATVKWEVDGHGHMPRQQLSLLLAGASLIYHKAKQGPTTLEPAEGGARKRARTTPLLLQVCEGLSTAPQQWAPVLAAILKQHGYSLEPAVALQMLDSLLAALQPGSSKQPSGTSGGPPPQSTPAAKAPPPAVQTPGTAIAQPPPAGQAVLWVLRCLQQLARWWPQQLRGDGARAGGGSAGAQQVEGEIERLAVQGRQRWKTVSEALVSMIAAADASSPALDAAMTATAVLVHEGLADVVLRAQQLLAMPPLQKAPLLPAGAALIAATLARGGSGMGHEAAARSQLLELCLQTLGEVPGYLSPWSCAMAALLGLPAMALPVGRDLEGSDTGEVEALWGTGDAEALAGAEAIKRLSHGEEALRAQLWQARRSQAASLQPAAPAAVDNQSHSGVQQRFCVALHQAAAKALQDLHRDPGELAPAQHVLCLAVAAASFLAASPRPTAGSLGAASGARSGEAGDGGANAAVQQGMREQELMQDVLAAMAGATPALCRLLDAVGGVPAPLVDAYGVLAAQLTVLQQRRRRDAGVIADVVADAVVELQQRMLAAAAPAVDRRGGSQTTKGRRSTDDDLMLDDELDQGGAVKRSSSGTQQPSASQRLEPSGGVAAAARMLTALARCDPGAVGAAAERVWRALQEKGRGGEEAAEALAATLVSVVLSGGSEFFPVALGCLDSTTGLLSYKALTGHQLAAVLRLLEQLAVGLRKAAAAAAEGSQQTQEGLVRKLLDVVSDAADYADAIQRRNGEGTGKDDPGRTPWQLRSQLSRTAAQCIRLAPIRFQPGDGDLYPLCEGLMRLLRDPAFPARRTGARLVCVLLETWTHHAAILGALRPHLLLLSNVDRVFEAGDGCGSEYMETAILTIMEVAFSSASLEVEALVLLAGHVARCASQQGLAAAALDLLSARLACPSRGDLFRLHAAPFMWQWLDARHSLQQLMAVRGLLLDGGAAGPCSTEDFMREYGGAVLPAVLRFGDAELLEAAAELAGQQPRALLATNYEAIYGTFYPAIVTPAAAAAQAVLQGPLLASHLPEDEQDSLLSAGVNKAVAHMLSMAVPAAVAEAAAPGSPGGDDVSSEGGGALKPCYGVDTVVAAVLALPGQESAAENESVLWGRLLKGYSMAWLLLAVHQHVTQAHHPRHKLQRLASLEALLKLLGARITAPSTCRYAMHILLQLLHEPALQVATCALLTSIVDRLLQPQAAAGAYAPPALPEAAGPHAAPLHLRSGGVPGGAPTGAAGRNGRRRHPAAVAVT